MDPKTYEINNLRILNDYLAQTIEVLARTQRIGLNRDMTGLSHSQFGQSPFGVPVQGVDPRAVDYTGGLGHSPYSAYPYHYGMQPQGWTGQQQVGGIPTNIDPFYAQRSGLSHTPVTPWTTQGTPWTAQGTPWTGWNPYTAEMARQREFARQQYEAMCRPFGY